MQIIRNLNQIKNALPKLTLTVGNFDGVHLGHLEIFKQIKQIAKEKNTSSAILTFEPHPVSFLKPQNNQDFRITSLAQKLKIFSEQKIDYVIVLPFNQKLVDLAAEDFVTQILIEKLNLHHLIIGYDFTFGKNRQGNFFLLEKLAKKFGFGLSEILAVEKLGQISSSSNIRKLIKEGNLSAANQLLGSNFKISGLVSKGRKLASQLGFPTININPKSYIVKPKFGVYKSITFIPHLNQKFSSITNFGVKPTVSGDNIALFETHIPNFSQDIYDKKVIIELIDFIREEKKFTSIDALKQQIIDDLAKIQLVI